MPRKYPQDYVDRARGVFSEVGTYGGVARVLGVSDSWVRKVILESGQESARLGIPGAPRKLEGHEDAVLALAAEGLSARQIVTRLELPVHPETVGLFLRQRGVQRRKPGGQLGEDNPAWRGGKHIDKSGYVLIRMVNHPDRNSSGYVREHRLVMERVLGRRLLPSEVVHHVNGDRQDNRPENLEVFSSNAAHLGVTLKGRRPNWTPEGEQAMKDGFRAWQQAGGMSAAHLGAFRRGRAVYLRERRDEVLRHAARARFIRASR